MQVLVKHGNTTGSNRTPLPVPLPAIERLIVVLYAGASAADYILKLDGAFYDAQIASDKDQIDSLMASEYTRGSSAISKGFCRRVSRRRTRW
jgi:hypothetical protein